MAGRLRYKTAVVTAAGQGIGRAVTEAFLEEGAFVHAIDKNFETLRTIGNHSNLELHAADLCDTGSLKELISKVNSANVLFNGVGYVHVGDILECSDDDLDRSLDVNLTSMFRLTRGLLPGMISKNGGSIINMSSVQSSVRGFPKRCAYATSKAAVIGLTKSIAADFASCRIRCNAICPSAVDTPSMRQRIAAMEDPESAYKMFSARQPLGRMGDPRDISALAVYLASDESSFVTGTTILIDGGAIL